MQREVEFFSSPMLEYYCMWSAAGSSAGRNDRKIPHWGELASLAN